MLFWLKVSWSVLLFFFFCVCVYVFFFFCCCLFFVFVSFLCFPLALRWIWQGYAFVFNLRGRKVRFMNCSPWASTCFARMEAHVRWRRLVLQWKVSILCRRVSSAASMRCHVSHGAEDFHLKRPLSTSSRTHGTQTKVGPCVFDVLLVTAPKRGILCERFFGQVRNVFASSCS